MDASRFARLWTVNKAETEAEDRAAEIFIDLQRLYGEPHRHYHNGEHIDFVLARLDEVRGHLQNPDAVELALWFHDAIYRVGAADNERASADLFAGAAAGQLAQPLIDRVEFLIMATHHLAGRPPLSDSDACHIVDIDLASFALPWDRFKADGANLRREAEQESEDDFNAGVLRLIDHLIGESGDFYLSSYAREHWQPQAMANISRLRAEIGR